MKKTGFLIVRKPSMAHSLSLTISENIHIELLSAITVLFAWTKIPLPTMWKITVKKGSGKSAPFPGLNLSADSSCMCHRNDLLESDTTDLKSSIYIFSKTSAMRSICRALILQKQPVFLQSAQSLHNLREKIKNWKSIQISYTDAYFVHFGKIKRGANERAVFL